MKLKQFDFDLPSELIAQEPTDQRDESRLLVVDRKTGEISEMTFRDLSSFLEPGDRLIFNNSKVFPARLIGTRKNGSKAELLLTEELSDNVWRALARPGKKLKIHDEIVFSNTLKGTIIEDDISSKVVRFESKRALIEELDDVGIIPLPPYIKRDTPNPKDKINYQTVYAKDRGSIAAPTAGLHFTKELLQELEAKQVSQEMVTLHVGLGTFNPIIEEDISKHQMHHERYFISPETQARLNTKSSGRTITVGTTSLRTLESAANDAGQLAQTEGNTNLFITPGYRFKYVDHLLTNFHLPKSSLFILICAFMGEDLAKKAYKYAVENKFRFFSYGDAMLIL